MVCECVKKVSAAVPKGESVAGIGFDATCSLVLFDADLKPLTVSPTKENDQNVMMWLDHRAKAEADFINSLKHDILKYVGGQVSLEMEIPKLLWLKRNLSETFKKIHLAFDLPDFLTWRATGDASRSICSLTCKWNYDAVKGAWADDYFKTIGLEELAADGFSKIGKKILFPGDRIGGLCQEAANAMGLAPGTPVGCSMIDAHAGALGLIAARSDELGSDMTSKLILIAGTSTCHMMITEKCLFSPGIWGPYKHALLPNYYLLEAGQSATGLLIDHYCLKNHRDYQSIVNDLAEGENIHDRLYNVIMQRGASLKSFHELTKDFHVYPDFHGNRSPISDSNLKGAIVGLTMDDSIYTLYLAVIQALAYQTRHIIDSLYKSGSSTFKTILICGGLSKNKLFIQTHADAIGVPVSISEEAESVLLGAAMLGASASGCYKDLQTAAKELSNKCHLIAPDSSSFDFHTKKYKVFLAMLEDQRRYSKIISE